MASDSHGPMIESVIVTPTSYPLSPNPQKYGLPPALSANMGNTLTWEMPPINRACDRITFTGQLLLFDTSLPAGATFPTMLSSCDVLRRHITPLPEVGYNALFRTVRITNNSGTTLVYIPNFPQYILDKGAKIPPNIDLHGRDVGSQILSVEIPPVQPAMLNMASQWQPFIITLFTQLPSISAAMVGGITISITLAPVNLAWCTRSSYVALNATNPDANTTNPNHATLLANRVFVHSPDMTYRKALPTFQSAANSQDLTKSTKPLLDLAGVDAYLNIACRIYLGAFVDPSTPLSPLTYPNSLVMNYKYPTAYGLNQLATFSVTATVKTARYTYTDATLYGGWHAYYPVCAANGTYDRCTLNGQEIDSTYMMTSMLPTSQLFSTISDLKRASMLNTLDLPALVAQCAGEFRSRQFNSTLSGTLISWNQVHTPISWVYPKLRYDTTTKMFYDATVPKKTSRVTDWPPESFNYLAFSSTQRGVGAHLTCVYDTTDASTFSFLFPTRSIRAPIGRVGHPFSFMGSAQPCLPGTYSPVQNYSATAYTLSGPVPYCGPVYPMNCLPTYCIDVTPGVYWGAYTPNITFSAINIALDINTVTQVSPSGILSGPAPASAFSTGHLYKGSQPPAEGTMSTSVTSRLPLLPIQETILNATAFEVNLPDAGFVLAANLCVSMGPTSGPFSECASAVQVGSAVPYLDGVAACASGRYSCNAFGDAGMLIKTTFIGKKGGSLEVLDPVTALAWDQMSWSREEQVQFPYLNSSGGDCAYDRRLHDSARSTMLSDELLSGEMTSRKNNLFRYAPTMPGGATTPSAPAMRAFTTSAATDVDPYYYPVNNNGMTNSTIPNINITLSHLPTLRRVLMEMPLGSIQKIRFELLFDEQGAYHNAGSCPWDTNITDPELNTILKGIETMTGPLLAEGSGSVPPSYQLKRLNIRPSFYSGTNGARQGTLQLQIGFVPQQTEIRDSYYAAGARVVVPHFLTYTTTLQTASPDPTLWVSGLSNNLAQPMFQPLPSSLTGPTLLPNCNVFGSMKYPTGFAPAAVGISWIYGLWDSTHQTPYVRNTLLNINTANLGTFYSVFPLSQRNVFTTKAEDVSNYLNPASCDYPVIRPMLDGAEMFPSKVFRGAPVENLEEFVAIFGRRPNLKHSQVFGLHQRYQQTKSPQWNLYDAMLMKVPALAQAYVGAPLLTSPDSGTTYFTPAGPSCRGHPGASLQAEMSLFNPPVSLPICLELGSRVVGSAYLTLNWTFLEKPLTALTDSIWQTYGTGTFNTCFPNKILEVPSNAITQLADPTQLSYLQFVSSPTVTQVPNTVAFSPSSAVAIPAPSSIVSIASQSTNFAMTQIVRFQTHETYLFDMNGITKVTAGL